MECLRCGKEFTDPVPEVTNPEGVKEIACVGWCADCNSFTMTIAYRGRSAYGLEVKDLVDPIKRR